MPPSRLRPFAPVACLLFAAAPPPGGAAEDAPVKDDPRPNVVILLCDDLGYGDPGCYGHPVIRTPHLDRLAGGGVRLTQFYAASPVCSPSRAGLMTGRTPVRAGIYDWIPEGSPVHLRTSEPTLPALLNNAGYDTCHVGKWHLSGEFNAPTQPQPDDHGFDRWFATMHNAAPSHRNPENFVRDGRPVGTLTGYSCDLVVDEAVRWLDGRQGGRSGGPSGGPRPFFLNVWFHEPHLPIASPPELTARYLSRSRTRDEAEYFANVTNVDRAVGTLLDALDDRGLAENTIVIFTSDNGPADRRRHRAAAKAYGSPGSLRGRKLWLYEGGIRVPGIVSWPGRVEPREDATPVGAVDLLPTLCTLTGTAPPDRPLDGADLSALWLRGEPLVRRTPLFWSYDRGLGGPVAAVREGPFVLLGRRDRPAGRLGWNVNPESQAILRGAVLGRFELYDLRDELQEFDLAAERSGLAGRMAATLTDLHREARDAAPPWELPEPPDR